MKKRITISDILRHFAGRHVASYFGRDHWWGEVAERRGRLVRQDILDGHKFGKERRLQEGREYIDKQYGKTWAALVELRKGPEPS